MTTADDVCPSCGEAMRPSQAALRVQVHGEDVAVKGLRHLRCRACGERLVGLETSKELRRRAYAQYRRDHGLLAAEEIQALREGLGMTQAQLAELLQLGANTISRWEADRLVQSASMDVLLRLVRDVPGNLEYLRHHAA